MPIKFATIGTPVIQTLLDDWVEGTDPESIRKLAGFLRECADVADQVANAAELRTTIATLESALANERLDVQFGDRRERYHSKDELVKALDYFKGQLAEPTPGLAQQAVLDTVAAPRETNGLVAMREVIARTTLSRTSLWRMVRQGTFPAPIQLTPTRIAWRERDLTRWIDQRQKPLS